MKKNKLPARLGDLTLEEKIGLLTGSSVTTTKGIKKKNVPVLQMFDGPHGVRISRGIQMLFGIRKPVTVFPCAAILGSTWDQELVGRVGAAIGEECRHLGGGALLGPGVNLKRSEAGGRNFEYYSEDPVLGGKMGAAFIRGVQSVGVAACVKHFACNEYEDRRFSADSIVDERSLRDLYLKPFEIAVKEGRPLMVMAAYNMINGTKAVENRSLLTDILRTQWGYQGLVVSDWSAVTDKALSVNAGMDLQMPGPVAEADEVLAEAVRTGRVSESWIDEAAGRVLALANSQAALVREKMDFDKNHQLAVQAAIEGSVLLKNEESLLPFDQSVLSIAIIGEDKNLYQGGGSSELTPRDFTACKTVLKKILPAVRVISAEGHKDGARNPLRLLKDAVLKAAACSVAVVFVRPLYRSETESADHKWFGLPSDQEDLIRQVSAVNPNTVVVLQSGSAVDMSAWIDDVHAVIYTGMSGEGGKEAVMKMVFGFEQPSGRLSETFPAFRGLAPDYCCRVDGSDKAIYGERQYIGYRYYDKTGYPLQYPFGYGLGYGKIEASDFEVGGTAIQSGGEIAVSFTVKNTGNRRAVEVFQLYAGKPSGYYDHPEKELAVFQKVRLEPGQTRKISLALKADDLVSYDAYYKEFFLVPGAYRLSLNTDSQTALWTSEVQALSPDYPVRPISEHDELKKFMASEEGRKALKDLIARPEIKEKIPQLKNIEQLLLGGDCPLFRMVALSGGVITPEMTRAAAESVNRERKALAK